MKGKYPLSKAKLNAVLLELLRHPEVNLQFRHMTAQQGKAHWHDIHPPTHIYIDVDANQQTGALDHISTVIHELLHVVFMPMCLGWLTEDMEEEVILSLDKVVTDYIRRSPKRLHTWEEAIAEKLKETDS